MEPAGVRQAFLRRFGREPSRVVRAPGAVRLLGEELDAHGLPVLSLAHQKEVRLAFGPRGDGLVRIQDLRPGGGETHLRADGAAGEGAGGSLEVAVRTAARAVASLQGRARGFDAVLASELPAGRALGGDAAIRVAVSLALADPASGEAREPDMELGGALAAATSPEDGVDHAVSLGGRAGCALLVEQGPLRVRSLLVPPDWRVVAAPAGQATSGVTGRAAVWREQRRAECREARERLARHLEPGGASRASGRSWAHLLDRTGGPREALAAAGSVLSGPRLKRARHLLSEADRVGSSRDRLLLADLHGFGALLDACHGSLRADYLASSAALDALAAAALEGGAAGAHLTAGGWVVALADAGTAPGVLEAMAGSAGRDGPLAGPFVARPSPGAVVVPFPQDDAWNARERSAG